MENFYVPSKKKQEEQEASKKAKQEGLHEKSIRGGIEIPIVLSPPTEQTNIKVPLWKKQWELRVVGEMIIYGKLLEKGKLFSLATVELMVNQAGWGRWTFVIVHPPICVGN